MFRDFLYVYWPLMYAAFLLFAFVGICLYLLHISHQERLAERVQRGQENGLRLSGKEYKLESVYSMFDRRILDAVMLSDERSGLVVLNIPAGHPSWELARSLKEGERFTLSYNEHGGEWGKPADLSLEDASRYVTFQRV